MKISNKAFPFIKWGGVLIASIFLGLSLSWTDSVAASRTVYNLEIHCIQGTQYAITKHRIYRDAGGGIAPVLKTNGKPRSC